MVISNADYRWEITLPNVERYARINRMAPASVRRIGKLYYAQCGVMQGYGATINRALRALDDACAQLIDSVPMAA